MDITRITKDNERSFLPFCARSAAKGAPDLIRIGAIEGDMARGALSARIEDGIADITSLYILPGDRRRGYGKALAGKLEEFMEGSDVDAICAAFPESDDLNHFFDSLGYVLFPGMDVFYFTLGELLMSRIWEKHIKGRKTAGLKKVSEISARERNALDTGMGFYDYDPEWSTVCLEDRKCTSSLLAVNTADNVSIAWINSDKDDPSILLQHLRALTDKTMEEYPGRRDIRFRMVFDEADLSGKLEQLLGGRGHLKSEGRMINAVKLK